MVSGLTVLLSAMPRLIKYSDIACIAWALRAIIIFAADEAATSGKRFNRFPEDIAKKHLTL